MDIFTVNPDTVYLVWDEDDDRGYIRDRYDDVFYPGAFDLLHGMSQLEAYGLITHAMLTLAKNDYQGVAKIFHELLSLMSVYRFPYATFDTEHYASRQKSPKVQIYQ